MARSLITEDCSSAALANELFSTVEGLLILIPHRTCQNPFSFTIPSGCYALVTSKGVDLDYLHEDGERSAIWPPGLHFPYPPWYRISFLVTKQSNVFEVPVKACRTRDDVNVDIDVGLTFRIMGDTSLGEDSYLVRKLVHELKTTGLEHQLRSAQEAVMRAIVRNLDHTSIYGIRTEDIVEDQTPETDTENNRSLEISGFVSGSSASYSASDNQMLRTPQRAPHRIPDEENIPQNRESVTERIKEALNDQFLPQGVQILSVTIKSVNLPTNIQSQMSQDGMAASTREQQNLKHDEEMYQSRMEDEVRGLLQSYGEEREEESQKGLEGINKEIVRLEDAIAQSKKAEAEIREDARVRIKSIHEKYAYEIQKTKDASNVDTSAAKEKSQLYSTQIKADTELERQTYISDAQIESERNKAEADKIMAAAEGKIAKWVKKRNEFNISLQKIKNLEALADNSKLIISPSSNADENFINVADSILEASETSDVASVTAEMEMLKRVLVTPEKEEEEEDLGRKSEKNASWGRI